jgi:hypothetical protein
MRRRVAALLMPLSLMCHGCSDSDGSYHDKLTSLDPA